MVSFRLTAAEYEQFRDICFTHGIRNVSEMARVAINLLLQQPTSTAQKTLETRVSELEGRLNILALELKQIESGRRMAMNG